MIQQEDVAGAIQVLLNYMEIYVAEILDEISRNKPKICVVERWPKKLMVEGINGKKHNFMLPVNRMIKMLGCQLVVSKRS